MAIPLALLKVAKAALPCKCSSDNQIQNILGQGKGSNSSKQVVNICFVETERMDEEDDNDDA